MSKLPVLETEMTVDYWNISLASEHERLWVTLPKEFVSSCFDQWRKFQDGSETERVKHSRHYTGEWEKQGTMSFVAFAETGISERT